MRLPRVETIVLIGIVAAALAPSLFLGLVPVEDNILERFAPWLIPPVPKDSMIGGDTVFAYLPDRLAACHEWGQGNIPLWNPYISGGVSFLAMQTANPLDPLIFLHFVLPLGQAMGSSYALLMFAAGFGIILLLRELGITKKPALLLGGVAMALNPYFIYWLELRVFLGGLALLPLALWALQRIHTRSAAGREVAILGLAIGYSCVAGNLQTLGMFLGVLILRLAWLTVFEESDHPRSPKLRVRYVSLSLSAIIGGLSIGCLPIIASVEALGLSTRLDGAADYYRDTNFLPWRALGLWFSPDMYGWPGREEANVQEVLSRTLVSSSGWGALGILPLCLALFSLTHWRGPRKERIFWGGLAGGITFLLLLLSVPAIRSWAGSSPLLATMDLPRSLFLANLGGSVLAAWGASAWLDRWNERREKGPLIRFLILFALSGVAIVIGARTGVTTPNTLHRDLAPLAGIMVGMIALTLAARSARKWMAWPVVAIAATELLCLHFMYNDFAAPDQVLEEKPILTELQEHLGPPDYSRFMVLGLVRALPSNTGSAFQLSEVGGYSSSPNVRYRELIEWAEGSSMGNKAFMSRVESPIYRLLAGNYFPFHTEYEMHPRYGQVPTADSLMTLFKRKNYLPRAFMVHLAVEAPSKEQVREIMANTSFAPGKYAVLENLPDGLTLGLPSRPDSVRILSYESDRVEIRSRSDAPGLLILGDAYYPGWKVKVNGKASEILPANWAVRGVPLGRGEHHVEFVYQPWWLLPGSLLSGSCLLLAGALLLISGGRSRNQQGSVS